MKKYYYKNIHIIGHRPYKALYMAENERAFFLYFANYQESKKEVMKKAKNTIDFLNEELRENKKGA